MRFAWPVRRNARLALLALVGTAGCGLISSDITKISFDLPPKTYHFETPAGVPAGTTPVELDLPISVSQSMNLQQEVPQLQTVHSQSLVDVFISQIAYRVTSTLNVPLPPVAIYLAPAGVTDASDPQAKKFGTVPSIPAMVSNASGTVMLEPDAQQTFAGYAHAFGTPFNFIATTTIVVPAGSPVPNGAVDITISGQISAQASL